ncbi:ParB/RepB/Spo0J family partition protein [Thiotrichales bacterium 19S3-7]|nr:ParB/RepB/Spo0J family partition protein [Thiotrichales bacterium 19S3-7]MCF6801698.1 ParB/RepB/Spo0J family partition protein [Thiotrichales bacterium 19S3-11]
MSKGLLSNRKRLSDLGVVNTQADLKKDELLAMKLNELNTEAQTGGSLLELSLTQVKPDPNQPRKVFKNIDSLAASIREKGVLQPIIVRRNENGEYTLIAGERRYRAAKMAQLSTIPAIVREEKDSDVLIIQLLENDQREKVSPFEEADAIYELIKHKQMKKSQIAKSLGRDLSWVSMRLKLNEGSASLRRLSDDGIIDDVRTLYELKKFEDETPELARDFVRKIRESRIRGSFRQAISRARSGARKQQGITDQSKVMIEVEQIDVDGDLLTVYITGKKPYQFRLNSQLKAHILNQLQQND